MIYYRSQEWAISQLLIKNVLADTFVHVIKIHFKKYKIIHESIISSSNTVQLVNMVVEQYPLHSSLPQDKGQVWKTLTTPQYMSLMDKGGCISQHQVMFSGGWNGNKVLPLKCKIFNICKIWISLHFSSACGPLKASLQPVQYIRQWPDTGPKISNILCNYC